MNYRGKNIDELLKHGLPSASNRPKEHMDSIANRALEQLMSKAEAIEEIDDPEDKLGMPASVFSTRWIAVPIAATLLLAIASAMVWQRSHTFARVERPDGSFSRLQAGDVVHTTGAVPSNWRQRSKDVERW